MKLLLNGKEVSFQMEKPLSLNELIEEVQENIAGDNLYVIDYVLEAKTGKEAPLSSDDIESIDFEIGSQDELMLSAVEELDAYLDRAGLYLADHIQSDKGFSPQEEEEFRDGVNYISGVIESLQNDRDRRTEQLDQAMIVLAKSADLRERIGALAVIKNQVAVWKNLMAVANLDDEQQDKARSSFLDRVDSLNDELEKMATWLTQGKEVETYDGLAHFIDEITHGVALFSMMEEKQEVVRRLINFLEELTSALDSRDLVTAADILDFDLRDTLEELR